jgi:hypothetical protein
MERDAPAGRAFKARVEGTLVDIHKRQVRPLRVGGVCE